MNQTSALSFATWLSQDQPELFVALYKKAKQAVNTLGDFTDILSSIGDSVSNAASAVGDYVTSSDGLAQLTSLAGVYLNNQAAQTAVNLNLQRAQAGAQAAPIQTVYNPNTGQYQAVVSQPSGAVIPITATVAQSLTSTLPAWWPWALGGAGIFLLILLLRR